MPNGECECSGAEEILSDLLEEDLLDLEAGERLWKLYCFRQPGDAHDLRHRIYTKRKPAGRLAMITFAAHNPFSPQRAGAAPVPRPVRSALARVPDLSPADLDRLIAAMQAQAGDLCEEIDLSDFESLEDQLAWLRQQIVR